MSGYCSDCRGTECWCPKPPPTGSPTVTFNGWTYIHSGEGWSATASTAADASRWSEAEQFDAALDRIYALECELARKRYWIAAALHQLDQAATDLRTGAEDQFGEETP